MDAAMMSLTNTFNFQWALPSSKVTDYRIPARPYRTILSSSGASSQFIRKVGWKKQDRGGSGTKFFNYGEDKPKSEKLSISTVGDAMSPISLPVFRV